MKKMITKISVIKKKKKRSDYKKLYITADSYDATAKTFRRRSMTSIMVKMTQKKLDKEV